MSRHIEVQKELESPMKILKLVFSKFDGRRLSPCLIIRFMTRHIEV